MDLQNAPRKRKRHEGPKRDAGGAHGHGGPESVAHQGGAAMPRQHKSVARRRRGPDLRVLPRGTGPVYEPHDHDVLCGRGGRTNAHPGNKHLRALAEMRKAEYVHPKTKKLEKAHMAAAVVREIRRQNPPGRFLKVDTNDGAWYEIGDAKAIKKVGQCLREYAPDVRQGIESDGETENAKSCANEASHETQEETDTSTVDQNKKKKAQQPAATSTATTVTTTKSSSSVQSARSNSSSSNCTSSVPSRAVSSPARAVSGRGAKVISSKGSPMLPRSNPRDGGRSPSVQSIHYRRAAPAERAAYPIGPLKNAVQHHPQTFGELGGTMMLPNINIPAAESATAPTFGQDGYCTRGVHYPSSPFEHHDVAFGRTFTSTNHLRSAGPVRSSSAGLSSIARSQSWQRGEEHPPQQHYYPNRTNSWTEPTLAATSFSWCQPYDPAQNADDGPIPHPEMVPTTARHDFYRHHHPHAAASPLHHHHHQYHPPFPPAAAPLAPPIFPPDERPEGYYPSWGGAQRRATTTTAALSMAPSPPEQFSLETSPCQRVVGLDNSATPAHINTPRTSEINTSDFSGLSSEAKSSESQPASLHDLASPLRLDQFDDVSPGMFERHQF